MLAADARYSMPPLPQWYRGHDEIRAFLSDGPLQSRWRFLPTIANSQLAFGTYLWQDFAGGYVPGGLDVLTLRDGRVAEVVAFLSADFTRFGLAAASVVSGPGSASLTHQRGRVTRASSWPGPRARGRRRVRR